jgi:hypothetical protein
MSSTNYVYKQTYVQRLLANIAGEVSLCVHELPCDAVLMHCIACRHAVAKPSDLVDIYIYSAQAILVLIFTQL